MNWDSISAFIEMGGYGGFVWGSFAVTALCMVLEIVLATARHRAARRQLTSDSAENYPH